MRCLTVALSALALSACGTTIQLSKPDGETVATGIFEPRLKPPHKLTIILDGKIYEGGMEVKELGNSAGLRKRFGATSKHYQRIISGLDTDHHIHQYKGTLKATDGATLSCEYLGFRNGETLGVCEDDQGHVYKVHR